MKKTLGVLAVVGAAAAFIAYKIKKEESYEDFSELNEEDITEKILKKAEEVNYVDEEEGTTPPAIQSTSYPNLNQEDILRLNEVGEELFSKLDEDTTDDRTERPLQHTIQFENEEQLQAYKNIVISEGYVVTGGEDPNKLIVLNITKVNPDEILSRIFSLANKAKEYNGEYIKCILK